MPAACAAARPSAICSGQIEQVLEGCRGLDGRALDEFHDEVIRPDVVELADVRMVQRGDGPGFTLEAFGQLVFARP